MDARLTVDPKRPGRCIWCGDTTKATRANEDGDLVRVCKRCQKSEYPSKAGAA